MTVSLKCILFIKNEEGCRLTSYQDKAGVWTIGWGSTMYESGKRVGKGEKISQAQADSLLKWEVGNKTAAIYGKLKNVALNQNQIDALISFAFNVGVGGFEGSTLLKVIRKNPCDPYIRDCFAMWNKVTVNGKKVVYQVLVNRRKREADLYFSSIV